jgi:hypothetical protein
MAVRGRVNIAVSSFNPSIKTPDRMNCPWRCLVLCFPGMRGVEKTFNSCSVNIEIKDGWYGPIFAELAMW